MLIFYASKIRYVDIEKPHGICPLEFSGLFLHPSIFFHYTLTIYINNK